MKRKAGNKRAKTSATTFAFHSLPPENAAPEPSDRIHRHLSFNTSLDGRVTSAVNFFQAPASPQKAAHVPRWADTLYDETFVEDQIQAEESVDPADTGFIDPDYVTFLNEITLEPLPRKRRRPRSVSRT